MEKLTQLPYPTCISIARFWSNLAIMPELHHARAPNTQWASILVKSAIILKYLSWRKWQEPQADEMSN